MSTLGWRSAILADNKMDHRRNEEGFIELKINIKHLYEIASIGIISSREAAKEVKTLLTR